MLFCTTQDAREPTDVGNQSERGLLKHPLVGAQVGYQLLERPVSHPPRSEAFAPRQRTLLLGKPHLPHETTVRFSDVQCSQTEPDGSRNRENVR